MDQETADVIVYDLGVISFMYCSYDGFIEHRNNMYDIFLEELDDITPDDMKDPITMSLMVDPRYLVCGHKFSETTILNVHEYNGFKCPLCRVISEEYYINIIDAFIDKEDMLHRAIIEDRCDEYTQLRLEFNQILGEIKRRETPPTIENNMENYIKKWNICDIYNKNRR